MFARLLLCFFALFLTIPVFAEEAAPPMTVEGGRVITVNEAKAYFDSGKALFVDVRNPLNYGKGHISSAIAAPFEKNGGDEAQKHEFLKKLPRDKRAPIVVYSHGNTGWKSYYAAGEAIKEGYANIMWMREGFKAWTSKGFAVSSGQENN